MTFRNGGRGCAEWALRKGAGRQRASGFANPGLIGVPGVSPAGAGIARMGWLSVKAGIGPVLAAAACIRFSPPIYSSIRIFNI